MRSRVIGAAVLGTVLVAGAGCSDDDPGGSGAERSSTVASSDASSESPSASDPEPSVEPASGEPTGLEGVLSFRLSAEHDWRLDEEGGATYARAWTGNSFISILADDNRTSSTTFEEEFPYVFDVLPRGVHKYERAENRTVAGVEGWTIVGRAKRGERFYQWGTVREGRTVTLDFRYSQRFRGAEDWVSAVLASVEWE